MVNHPTHNYKWESRIHFCYPSCDILPLTFHLFNQKLLTLVIDNYKLINVDNIGSLTILSKLSKLANFIISNVSQLIALDEISLVEELL